MPEQLMVLATEDIPAGSPLHIVGTTGALRQVAIADTTTRDVVGVAPKAILSGRRGWMWRGGEARVQVGASVVALDDPVTEGGDGYFGTEGSVLFGRYLGPKDEDNLALAWLEDMGSIGEELGGGSNLSYSTATIGFSVEVLASGETPDPGAVPPKIAGLWTTEQLPLLGFSSDDPGGLVTETDDGLILPDGLFTVLGYVILTPVGTPDGEVSVIISAGGTSLFQQTWEAGGPYDLVQFDRVTFTPFYEATASELLVSVEYVGSNAGSVQAYISLSVGVMAVPFADLASD